MPDSPDVFTSVAPQRIYRQPTIAEIEALITEDDTPVDNFPSEKFQRLLIEVLYSTWAGLRGLMSQPFIAASDVALQDEPGFPPIVPDVFLSVDVEVAEDWWAKENRSYCFWKFGKPPEVVMEIVSNQKGQEDTRKLKRYAEMEILYYVIYDPRNHLRHGVLRLYRLRYLQKSLSYELIACYKDQNKGQNETFNPEEFWLNELGLGLTLWKGSYEQRSGIWLRWCDRSGEILLTGAERAEQEAKRALNEARKALAANYRADQEAQRAEEQTQRAQLEAQRAKQLEDYLRSLGIDPTQI